MCVGCERRRKKLKVIFKKVKNIIKSKLMPKANIK